jgi:hypothetical protein
MNQYYISKAKASFTTKLNLFLYEHTLAAQEWSLTLESFNRFKIAPAMVREYTTQYWQWDYSETIRGQKIGTIYKAIDALKQQYKETFTEWERHYVTQVFPTIFSEAEFASRIGSKECYYCQITVDEINQLVDLGNLNKKKDRGWKLEIDRLDSNLEYTFENTVMCCYWCNNAKTDEFTPTEFKIIGKAIREVWNQRLRGNRFSDGIEGIRIIKPKEIDN